MEHRDIIAFIYTALAACVVWLVSSCASLQLADEATTQKWADEAIEKVGADGPKDMGKVSVIATATSLVNSQALVFEIQFYVLRRRVSWRLLSLELTSAWPPGSRIG